MRRWIMLLLCGWGYCAMAMDFSGTYQCYIRDHTDGSFKATLTLKLDPQASFAQSGYGSYLVNLNVAGIPYSYTGIAAARGNELAIYFESTGEKKNPDDRGVGIASVLVEQDESGQEMISIHKFYYEKFYKEKSNYGYEVCQKKQ